MSFNNVLTANTANLPDLGCWTSFSDAANLLPTDDQLDQYVESLCEGVRSLQTSTTESQETSVSDNVSVDTSVGEDSLSNNVAPPSTISGILDNHCGLETESSNANNGAGAECKMRNVEPIGFGSRIKSFKPAATSSTTEKRSATNTLNLLIMQCSRATEHLVQKRKRLESLIQLQNNSENINYMRLPDVPTRVDRLAYDLNQERFRIVGLVSNLDSCISSFRAQSTNEEIRTLISEFGSVIMEVMKERHSEISYYSGPGYEAGAQKLTELLQIVNRYIKKINTMLWCLELKVQVELVKSRKVIPKMYGNGFPQEVKSTPSSPFLTRRQVWKNNWTPPQGVGHEMIGGRGRIDKPPCSPKMNTYSNTTGLSNHQTRNKGRQYQNGMYALQPLQQQKHLMNSAVMPSSPRQKRSAAAQLLAQQQRAEIIKQFSSSLKNKGISG